MAIIRNSTFIGKGVLGATAGAPLSADANGLLASGISTSSVNSTANVTTASATDVLMTGMTITPVAGTYLVLFSTSFQHSANNASINFSLYAGGTVVAGTNMTAIPTVAGGLTPSLPFSVPGSVSAFATVNGAQAIEVRWRTSAATATAGPQRILNIIRIS